jgi:hypothetical protein
VAISRRQGGFNNQQGREEAAEGSGVGADGSTMYDDAMMVAANNDRGRGGRRLAARGRPPLPHPLDLSRRR